MENHLCTYELYCVIVNNHIGTKVIKMARELGISGATVMMAKGTIQSGVLSFLGINDIRREMVLMAARRDIGDEAFQKIATHFAFHKPSHGIGFSIPLTDIIGAKSCVIDPKIQRKKENTMYDLIFIVVDRGNAEFVVDAATKAGAHGATILNARGSGIHETQKVFHITIEPEKEMVMILAKKESTKAITESIKTDLDIEKPGKGVIFVMDVTQTVGLYQGPNEDKSR